MIHPLRIDPSDRILYIAPHPDDESIGGGGLVQRAMVAGAKLQVVFITDGDRNPWPQRVMERRLVIDDSARRRWGARRRAEALRALELLGCGDKAGVRFLGWSDQGATGLLMRADEAALNTFVSLLLEVRPTLLALPTADDTHSDHSAIFVLMQLALERVRGLIPPPRQLCYVVHHPRVLSVKPTALLALSEGERLTKRYAIERHETQMLSRRRFIAHAREQEIFYAPADPGWRDYHHPVAVCGAARGALQLRLKLPQGCRSFSGAKLHFATETMLGESVRWSLRLPGRTSVAQLIDERTGALHRAATFRVRGRTAIVLLPIANLGPLNQLFVKLESKPLFFDVAGWREIAVELLEDGAHLPVQIRKPRTRIAAAR